MKKTPATSARHPIIDCGAAVVRSGASRRSACIILAAGRGTRMGAPGLPKVCFPVVGVPVINRSIAAYRECGIETIVVVVGDEGQQVIDTVSADFDGILFARQRDPRGTGDAARAGFEPLRRMKFDGAVFCAVGDKVVQPEAVRAVQEAFFESGADAAIAVTQKPRANDMGRVVVNARGNAVAVVEENTLRTAELMARIARLCNKAGRTINAGPIRDACAEALGAAERCERFLGRTWKALANGGTIPTSRLKASLPTRPGMQRIDGRWLTPAEVRKQAPFEHESLYVFKSSAFDAGLRKLKARAHGEIYLTDIIEALAAPAKRREPLTVRPVLLDNPDWMLGVNTPEQLLNLEEKARVRVTGPQPVRHKASPLSRRVCKPAGEWARLLTAFPPKLRRRFSAIYGPDRRLIEAKRREILRPVKKFCKTFGVDRKVIIVRAPATVNLMGRHIDVVGGFINVTNIDRDAIMVAGAREDDLVRLAPAVRGDEGPSQFAIGHEIAGLGWNDWLTYISSERVRDMVARARGTWLHIARAAAVRLQQHFRTNRLRGMDAVIQSNIPLASGLGASSAMLVAASEALVTLNALKISPHQFVLLCGEGEWYLGSRGTAAPHAGVKMGRRGQVAHVRTFPFEVDTLVPFPKDLRLALCDSGASREGVKGLAVRGQALASMEVALRLLKDRQPHLAHLMEHVRDLHPARLGLRLRDLYGMLLDIPRRCPLSQVARLLSAEGRAGLDRILEPAKGARSLRLRDTLCFGMAECARGEAMAGILERADMRAAAAFFRASHDAERVVQGDGIAPYRWAATDAYLKRCMDDLASEDPERVWRAQLPLQPGRFASGPSLRVGDRVEDGPAMAEVDRIVDLAQNVPGIIGAQLSGAGPYAMVLAEEDAIPSLKRALRKAFDSPGGFQTRIDVSSFVEAAGALEA